MITNLVLTGLAFVAGFIAGVLFGRRNKEKVEAGVAKAKKYVDK